MKYRIEHANNAYDLEKTVNDLILKGWQPHGGVAAVFSDGHAALYQAMTRTEAKPNPAPHPTLSADATSGR